MSSHRSLSPLVRLAVAGLPFAMLALPVPGSRVIGSLILVGALPGLALTARSPSRRFAGVALASSPILFGFVTLALAASSIHPYVAGRCAAVFWAALFVALPRRRHPRRTSWRVIAGLTLVAAAAAVLAFTLPLSEVWWHVRQDSWFHAAVFERLVHHGFPLVDPYFTPLRLQYAYFYHVVLAGMAGLSGLGPFHAMIAVNALALVGCVAAFDTLGRAFSTRAAPRLMGAVLLLFGLNGWFFLFYPLRLARVAFGATRGASLLPHFFPWSPLGVDTAARLLSIEGNQVLFLDKFMVGTALSLTFGLVSVTLALLVSARRGAWSGWHDLVWTLALTGIVYTHPVVGLAVLAATLAVLALLAVTPSGGAPAPVRLIALALLSFAAAVPYLYSVMPRGGGGASFGVALRPGYLAGLASDVLPALALGAVMFWRDRGHDGVRGGEGGLMGRVMIQRKLTTTGVLVAWAIAAALIAAFVNLPTTNETKFAFPLYIVLAAFAVGGIDRLWDGARGRAAVVVLVATCAVPLNAIYYYHAFHDPTSFVETDAERALYAWIDRSTPLDAVFIEDDDIVRVPVLASRDQYWGTAAYARNWEYPAATVRTRRAIRDAVFGEHGLAPDQIEALRALDRPVYVVCRGVAGEHRRCFERLQRDPLFIERFADGGVAVFQIRLAGNGRARGRGGTAESDSVLTPGP